MAANARLPRESEISPASPVGNVNIQRGITEAVKTIRSHRHSGSNAVTSRPEAAAWPGRRRVEEGEVWKFAVKVR